MADDNRHPDLRHDAPRRRAVARRQHEPRREARDRPGPGRPGRRHHRGRLPDRLAGRLRGRPRHRHRGRRLDHLRPGPLQRPRHRPRLGGRPVRPEAADPRLPRHLGDPPRAQAADDPRADHRAGRRRRPKRAKGYCDDVEFSPEDAARTEIDFLCEVVEAAIDAGATTVNIPDTVGYATPTQYAAGHPDAQGAGAEHRPGDHQRPLPRRPGLGRGQQPGRRRGRGPAGRVHDQRHRRARRQRRARGDRHGAADPPRLLRRRHRHQDRAALPDQPDALDRSPAWPCSGTRRSSAATPSPTSRASTRTACSRSARPTRSCGPRTSACPRPTSSWASTPAATP